MKEPCNASAHPTLWLAALLLSACVMPQETWRKNGVNPNYTDTVLAHCRYEIDMSPASADREKQLLANCMQAPGFRWRTV